MSDPATSLERLHDIVLPPSISWWPLAPGWHVVLALFIVTSIVLLVRIVSRFRANAYRRAALRELARAVDAPAIAELLRRTALAIAPRALIAEKTGTAWLDWLACQCPSVMPDVVREQLTAGVYDRPDANRDISALRDYAERWIATHRRPSTTDHSFRC